MKIKRVMLILLIGILFSLTCVSASDNITDDVSVPIHNNITLESNSLKDIIINAQDNDEIYLDNVTYSGEDNTQITIDKSINFIGSENTIIDGQNIRSIFIINDNVNVSFKNIKFVNASKTGIGSEIYGGALEIHNANVIIDNCQFISNSINHGSSEKIYGAAISNGGNLSISNSCFLENSLNSANNHEGFGGAIYNNGLLYVNNTSFIKSRGGEYSRGSAIYNNKNAVINNSIIADSYSFEESIGSAIFNNGDLTLLNSRIENNTIERYDFNYIYGNIFNTGLLIAYGNIFKNNTGYYKQPNSAYEGCPTIYNVGDLNLSYNAFIDNVGGFEKIYRDVYLNGGKNVYIDNNWWGSNENPSTTKAINFDKASNWLILDVTPSYSKLIVGEEVNITASWKLSNNSTPQFLFPFEVTFSDEFGHIQKSNLATSDSTFTFKNTQNRQSYSINVVLYSYEQTAIVDVGKLKTNMEIDVNNNIYSHESLIIKVYLQNERWDPIPGMVSLSVANKNVLVEVNERGRGLAIFRNIVPGTYELKVEYDGSNDYFSSNAKTNVTIKKYPVELKVDEVDDIHVDENFTVNVSLGTEEVEGAANLYLNGIFKQVVYLRYGNTSISFSNFEGGEYNLIVEIPGNEYYQKTNASTLFNVLKYEPNFSIASADIFIKENETLTITASQDFKGEVILSINNANYTLFLNNQTTNITLPNLAGGDYDVDLIFDGNAKFYPQNASTSFKVIKYSSDLIVNIDGNIINVKTLPKNCTGSVSVYVNRKYYRLNLTEGEASFDVEFDDGTNYIYVIYEGDYYYNQSRYNTTKGMGEAIAIIGENVTSWQYSDFNFTVQIFEKNGLAMKDRIISINVNSNTYEVVTNNQGMAILPLNLKEGHYEVISTYKNLTARNYLTVNPIVFDLTAINVTYGENAIIVAEFNKTITGKVNFTLSNGLTKVIDISNGKAIYTIENLSIGSLEVSAYYTNGLFNTTIVKTTFQVEKLNPNITLDIKEAFLGDVEVITLISDNLTGNVTFIVDGIHYNHNITNNTAELLLPDLSGSKHLLEVIYSGDDYHKNASLTEEFYIKTQKTDIIMFVNETAYGENINVIARVNGSGIIKFMLNNSTKTSQIIDGIANTTFNSLNVGSYTIYAEYLGDNQFMSTQKTSKLKVVKAKSTIEVYTGEVVLDENIRIYAKVSPNATGKVSFRITNYYSPRDKDVVNSTASWLIAPLEYGSYEVVATYRGDSNYYSSSTTFILNVTQTRSYLSVDVNDVSNNERVSVKITLMSAAGENITGNVILQIGSRFYDANIRNGKGTLVLGKLAPGNYTVKAIYEGSDEFSSSQVIKEFTVFDSLLESVLACNDVVKYYNNDDVKFVIALKNTKGKPISDETVYVTIKGIKTSYVTDSEGKVYLNIDNKLGKYDVAVEFMGNSLYHPSNTTGIIEILSTVQSEDLTKLYGTGNQYFAIFKDLSGKALMNTKVFFKILGKTYEYTTLPNGVVRLNINLNPGTYYITAINPVTGENKVDKITIFNKLMGNKDVTNYFGAKSTYKVRAFDINGKAVGAGKIVTFKVNGKTYKVKTDKNGYATLSVKLKVKSYTITAEFNGTKVSNKIIVKPVLTTKITFSKKTKKTKFTAKLINTKGKPVKGKKITFKIKGKKYKIKTNKKGIAILNIKLKLKKGTHKVYTIYGKSKVVNKIKVK